MCACVFKGPSHNPTVIKPCAAHAAWRADYATKIARLIGSEPGVSEKAIAPAMTIIDMDLDALTDPTTR